MCSGDELEMITYSKYNKNSPCYGNGNGCVDRVVGCHAGCKAYNDWKSEQSMLKKRGKEIGGIEADNVLCTRKQRWSVRI